MVSVGVYREMADRFLVWSAFVYDPVVRDLLRKRAEEYLRRADTLEADSSEPPAIGGPAPQRPAFQQQQQAQSAEKSDE